MAKEPFRPERFKLPTRIRTTGQKRPRRELRLKLVDRIAALDGVSVSACEEDTVPCRVDVYLSRRSSDRYPEMLTGRRLCSLSRDGVTVFGLDRWGRYQVVSRGWGTLDNDSVRLELPRDTTELEVAWRVVKRAYDGLNDSDQDRSANPIFSTWDFPRFSRTSLQ